ncbi:MAG: hypothetical protein Q9174_003532 [Haloplaca sp. 1 TL-2023]
MTSVAEVQALLRFLSQDAKVPVPVAMSKVKDLKEASLTTPETLSKAPLPAIQSIFPDEKMAKQILAAAKRTSRKRTSSSVSTTSPRSKRTKHALPAPGTQLSPSELETSLALPFPETKASGIEAEIKETVLYTNRAPLVVAFVVSLLKYTMPSQPLSSRLSLAQAVMSMGAKSKALNLGIQSGHAAEEEGWGEGQPKIKIMGREVRVMRRWGYDWQKAYSPEAVKQGTGTDDVQAQYPPTDEPTEIESQETIKGDPSSSPPPPTSSHQQTATDVEPPLWALNLETLRSTSNTSTLLSSASGTNLPIYDPHSARNYLYKSFASAPSSLGKTQAPSPVPKANHKKEAEEKEQNLAVLLHALDIVFGSWIHAIGPEELDRRAWGWYVRVRPEVEDGPRGWGGKGEVRLGNVLDLRR